MTPNASSLRRLLALGLGLLIVLLALPRLRGGGDTLPVISQSGEFSLTNQLGKAVSHKNLRGQVWVGNVIFTRCPGVCPVMTQKLADLRGQLPADVRLVSLTTDPEFDTPGTLNTFAERFEAKAPRWQFLTGPKETLMQLVVKDLKLTAQPKDDNRTHPNDLFIHSPHVVVVDRQGRVRAAVDSNEADMAPRLLAAVNQVRSANRPWKEHLPAINATLNSIATLLLLAGFIYIKRENKIAHRNCMVAAFIVSAVFLACYLLHHYLTGYHTKLRHPEAWVNQLYYTILISHILLAIVIVPLVFITLNHARRERFEKHRRIARITWPIWMYVSLTGVLVYLFLYVWFPQHTEKVLKTSALPALSLA